MSETKAQYTATAVPAATLTPLASAAIDESRWRPAAPLLGLPAWRLAVVPKHRKPGQWDTWDDTSPRVASRRAVWPFR